jgi:hypothetical protein
LAVYWLKTPPRVVDPGQEVATQRKVEEGVFAGQSRFWATGANVGKVGVLQGVAGSNPVSPTKTASDLRKRSSEAVGNSAA